MLMQYAARMSGLMPANRHQITSLARFEIDLLDSDSEDDIAAIVEGVDKLMTKVDEMFAQDDEPRSDGLRKRNLSKHDGRNFKACVVGINPNESSENHVQP